MENREFAEFIVLHALLSNAERYRSMKIEGGDLSDREIMEKQVGLAVSYTDMLIKYQEERRNGNKKHAGSL